MTRLRPLQAVLACALLLIGRHSAAAADLFDIEPMTPARVLDARYFGTHLHRLLPVVEPHPRTTPWPVGQIGALRLWDSTTRWADLEPTRGVFSFERLDAYVAAAQSQGASLLMVLGSAPRWAAARPDEPGPYGPGSAAEPLNLDDWDRYVSAIARRYKGRIASYELWNEPYFSDLPADRGHASAFFTGSLATMVEMARRTRAVLDREDPQAVLLTPGFVGDVKRMEMFLAAGGARYVGGVAYHYYAEGDREFIKLHRDIRSVMARHGISHLPLYNTESGIAARDDDPPAAGGVAMPDRTLAAALLSRSMLLGAFLGIDRFYQYAWDNGRSGMLKAKTLTPTPSRQAFAATRRWLLGTTLQGCRMASADTVQCAGTRDGARLLVAWQTTPGPPSTLQLPVFARVRSVEHAIAAAELVTPAAATAGVAIGPVPVAVWWQPKAIADKGTP